MDIETPAILVLLVFALVVFMLIVSRLNRITSKRLRELQAEYRVSSLKNSLQIVDKVRQGYEAAEKWLETRRSEQARAARLSRIPREIRILYEELDSLLNQVEASIDVDAKEDPELRKAYLKGLVRAGALALELDNPTGAIRRMKRALQEGESFISQSGEDLGQIQFVLGTAYMLWGAQEKSADEIRTAIGFLEKAASTARLDRIVALALHNLAWAYDELGRIEKNPDLYRIAIDILQDSLRIEPMNHTARYNLACDHALRGNYGEALQELQRIPADSEVWELAEREEDFSELRKDPQRKQEFERLLGDKLSGLSTAAGSPP